MNSLLEYICKNNQPLEYTRINPNDDIEDARYFVSDGVIACFASRREMIGEGIFDVDDDARNDKLDKRVQSLKQLYDSAMTKDKITCLCKDTGVMIDDGTRWVHFFNNGKTLISINHEFYAQFQKYAKDKRKDVDLYTIDGIGNYEYPFVFVCYHNVFRARNLLGVILPIKLREPLESYFKHMYVGQQEQEKPKKLVKKPIKKKVAKPVTLNPYEDEDDLPF